MQLSDPMDAITPTHSTETRVLIVDDELHARKLLVTMLGEGGVRCKTAACAEEALRILDGEPLDAMLVDLQMPRMSGMELLIKLRPLYPWLAFLMVTGVDDIRVGIEAMKNGADDYLVKPLQLEVVMASLERALSKKRLEQEVENYRTHLEEIVGQRTEKLNYAQAQIERRYEDKLEA